MIVRSAPELARALEEGVRDIVLSSHIDLSTLQSHRSRDNILTLGNATRSLRVCFCTLNAVCTVVTCPTLQPGAILARGNSVL
jgi:hypothetical protein